MKKVLLGFAMITALSTGLFAKGQWAIGAGIGSPTIVANLLVPMGPVSMDIDIGWTFWSLDTGSSFFTAIDFILWNPSIAEQLRFFIGVGPRLGFWASGKAGWGTPKEGGFFPKVGGFFIGPRVPIGLDWQPINHLSIVFKIAPGVSFGLGKVFYTTFSFDFGFGVRYVF